MSLDAERLLEDLKERHQQALDAKYHWQARQHVTEAERIALKLENRKAFSEIKGRRD